MGDHCLFQEHLCHMNYSINWHKVVLVGSAGVMYNSHVTYPQPVVKHDVLKKLFLFEIYQNTQK